MTLILDKNNSGIRSFGSVNKTKNLIIHNLEIVGNLGYENSKSNTSGMAIFIKDSEDIKVSHTKISNTRGGIYVNGENIEINYNHLMQVNFGNIVSSGYNIKIIKNHIEEAGKGSKFEPPHGDAITIGGNSDNVIIKDNHLETGYCYMLWAHGPLKNLSITGNQINSGVTTGFMVEGVTNATFSNNTFNSNLANGLALLKGGKNILIEDNLFSNDSLLIGSDVLEVTVKNNKFVNNYMGDKPLRFKNNVDAQNNNVEIIEKSYSKVQATINGKTINSGDSISIDGGINAILVTFKNIGTEIVSFYGFPQVILSDEVIEVKSRGPRSSGESVNGKFSVYAYSQPKVLTLAPNELTQFTVSVMTQERNVNSYTIVNIPNSSEGSSIYWFKLKIKDN